MILTILGGGGFRVPLVHAALLKDTVATRSDRSVTELRLFDTDPARLGAVLAVCREQAASHPHAPRVSTHTDLDAAVRGTDVVFSAVRVGGLPGRSCDEHLPLEHGVIGQETVGAGGILYGLRTLPVVTAMARRIRELAPEAWVINFTNPAGMVTEALVDVLGDRVVGICDSPVGLARRALTAAGVPRARHAGAQIGYVGLNHLGWLRALTLDGTDLLPGLMADPERLGSFEEGRLFGVDWLQALGDLPNEYLHHYYFAREDLQSALASTESRADQIMEQQADFYGVLDPTAPGALRRWEDVRLARERTYMSLNRTATGHFERDEQDLSGGGYEQVALAIMHAILHDEAATLVLNVPNRGRVTHLDDAAVIEASCRVDGSGIHPLPCPPLPDHGVGLVQQVKHAERRAIEAATTGSRTDAWLAMAAHPLVDSVAVARRLLDEAIVTQEGLAHLR